MMVIKEFTSKIINKHKMPELSYHKNICSMEMYSAWWHQPIRAESTQLLKCLRIDYYIDINWWKGAILFLGRLPTNKLDNLN